MAELGESSSVSVAYRAFELDPAAPATYPPRPSYVERLARKYALPMARAEQMLENMREVGRQEKIEFEFERIAGGNTFDAHRLLWWAGLQEAPLQSRLKERLLQAYFGEGLAVGDRAALLSIAGPGGLDVDAATAGAFGTEAADAVRAEQRKAAALGISGVPYFALGRYGVSGAQPPALLLNALRGALSEPPGSAPEDNGAAQACTPNGCS